MLIAQYCTDLPTDLPNLHSVTPSMDTGWFLKSLKKAALQIQSLFFTALSWEPLYIAQQDSAAQTAPWMYQTSLMPPRHNVGIKSSMCNDTSEPSSLKSPKTAWPAQSP